MDIKEEYEILSSLTKKELLESLGKGLWIPCLLKLNEEKYRAIIRIDKMSALDNEGARLMWEFWGYIKNDKEFMMRGRYNSTTKKGTLWIVGRAKNFSYNQDGK